ncbi:MAG TPA: protein translocase subunit SecF [Longimicrobiales bacterium]|nr:protein translocase subunit SecF [Longimicrobiales bacterium]
MRLFQNASYDFLGWRRRAYVISALAIAVLTAGALYFQLARGSWLNYGVDFLGGILVQVQIDRPTDVNEVRSVVNGVLAGVEVSRFGAEDEFLMRAPALESGTEVAEQIVAALGEHYGSEQVTMGRTETVTAKVGSELQTRALLALFVSFLATLIYLAFRFEWRFGVAALIATIHDVILTLLLISVLRLEVSLPTVAAVLTIVGYSLNDTIVIFDRIRENRKASGRRSTPIELINRSVNDTLARTVITGGSTLLALLSLFVLGGEVIREFALILILGIVLGTYSSIFIAAAALFEIEERAGEAQSHRRRSKESARAAV